MCEVIAIWHTGRGDHICGVSPCRHIYSLHPASAPLFHWGQGLVPDVSESVSHLLEAAVQSPALFSGLLLLGQDLWKEVQSEICRDGGREALQLHHPCDEEDALDALNTFLRWREV